MNSPYTNPVPPDSDPRAAFGGRGRRGHGHPGRGHAGHGHSHSDHSHGDHSGGGPERRMRHGGFGPDPFAGRGFFPGGRGGFGPGGPRGRRARKGDVRAAILSLLAENPANGYALIQGIAEQSKGAWKPSPGSVYPTLAQLVDEGLIEPVDSLAPRSDYRLTEAGQTYVSEHADELAATWNSLSDSGPLDATGELMQATQKLFGVIRQLATEATEEQQRAAVTKLDALRREFYRTLAE